jgi:hypothetical protein
MERVFACGLYIPEDLQFSVLLLNEHVLDCLLVFVVTEPNFKAPIVLLPSGIFWVVEDWFIKWSGYESFIESLSRLSIIKLVGRL